MLERSLDKVNEKTKGLALELLTHDMKLNPAYQSSICKETGKCLERATVQKAKSK